MVHSSHPVSLTVFVCALWRLGASGLATRVGLVEGVQDLRSEGVDVIAGEYDPEATTETGQQVISQVQDTRLTWEQSTGRTRWRHRCDRYCQNRRRTHWAL